MSRPRCRLKIAKDASAEHGGSGRALFILLLCERARSAQSRESRKEARSGSGTLHSAIPARSHTYPRASRTRARHARPYRDLQFTIDIQQAWTCWMKEVEGRKDRYRRGRGSNDRFIHWASAGSEKGLAARDSRPPTQHRRHLAAFFSSFYIPIVPGRGKPSLLFTLLFLS